jgi:shikimate dehydrogenase
MNDFVTGKTKVCCVIGDPVEHSLSPLMQNAAFKEKGLDYIYVPFNVRFAELGRAVHGIRSLHIKGANITIPHKVEVISYLDEIDTLAEKIGAVNTIVNRKGVLKGYNTDAAGFYQAMIAAKCDPEDKNVVLLGAGGAARAIAFMLAQNGAVITVINRNFDKAKELADHVFHHFGRRIHPLTWEQGNIKAALNKADVIVNATSIGMYPSVTGIPFPITLIRPTHVVFDLVYNPYKTRLLAGAEKFGARIISGLEMLVWQGAASFKLWTDQDAPVDIMKKVVLRALTEDEE